MMLNAAKQSKRARLWTVNYTSPKAFIILKVLQRRAVLNTNQQSKINTIDDCRQYRAAIPQHHHHRCRLQPVPCRTIGLRTLWPTEETVTTLSDAPFTTQPFILLNICSVTLTNSLVQPQYSILTIHQMVNTSTHFKHLSLHTKPELLPELFPRLFLLLLLLLRFIFPFASFFIVVISSFVPHIFIYLPCILACIYDFCCCLFVWLAPRTFTRHVEEEETMIGKKKSEKCKRALIFCYSFFLTPPPPLVYLHTFPDVLAKKSQNSLFSFSSWWFC